MPPHPLDAGRPVSSGPLFTVAAVARRLGVAPATLRTWDRRYGLGPTEHTAGAHRRYAPDDLARLMVMRRLTLDGVAPAEAARLARAGQTAYATVTALPLPPLVRELARPPTVDSGLDVAGSLGASARGDGGTGAGRSSVVLLPDLAATTRQLHRAALALDPVTCRELLCHYLDVHGVLGTWHGLLDPLLSQLSRTRTSTGEGHDVQLLLSECAVAVMQSVRWGLSRPRNSQSVVLAAAEHEPDPVRLHVIAAALGERGIGCRFLGTRVPVRSLAEAVRRGAPAVVLLQAADPVRESGALRDLVRVRPAPLLITAGEGWREVWVPSSAARAESVHEAVELVVQAVG